ncbi:MAG: calcium/sodium antiporter [Sphingomonadales bacterium]
MMTFLQALAGLVILIAAGDILVRGAVSLAARLGVSPLLISLTVVAFGTSAPELVVGVQASLAGAPALVLGNVIGSNIANVLLVLGLPALIFPILCRAHDLTINMVHMLMATGLFVALAFLGTFGLWQGVLFLGLLALFLVHSGVRAKKDSFAPEELADVEGMPARPYGFAVSVALVVAGLIGLAVGADMLVDGATLIARDLGVPEEVIGLTLVAVGTSLPELVTAVMAAIHKHGDVAIGNVLGSNIFNLYGIIGVSALIAPLPMSESTLGLDMWIMAGAALLIVPFVLRRGAISAPVGALFLTGYGVYMWLLATGARPALDTLT